jgi:hypothetical protein
MRLMKLQAAALGISVLTGAVIYPAAAHAAKKRGVGIQEKDKPRANAMGKARYASAKLGVALLQASYISPAYRHNRRLRTIGRALTAASATVFTLASSYGYVKRASVLLKTTHESKNQPV